MHKLHESFLQYAHQPLSAPLRSARFSVSHCPQLRNWLASSVDPCNTGVPLPVRYAIARQRVSYREGRLLTHTALPPCKLSHIPYTYAACISLEGRGVYIS